ncbi:MAG: MXAN_5187 C-terminal domain-containing protein [Myxococcales bacterium]|nr:cache domain-containing protein [Myxococcota bacterium]MDW8282336.1 MXAN_5187 C-terminal domain-containing protein [Myxococcales bacterium]
MFPTKISLAAAGLVVLLTAIVHQVATGSLAQSAVNASGQQLERAAGLFLSQSRLQALEFSNEVAQYARQESLARVFSIEDEVARRRAAHQAANALNDEHISKMHDRRAALVALLDATGMVVARDLNLNALHGENWKARYPSVAMALEGHANKDVWAFNNRMYRVACAPIRAEGGRIVGVLVVGFEESAEDARVLRDAFGTEVVVFLDGKIFASSFPPSQGRASIKEQDLARVLFHGPNLAGPTVRDRRQTAPFRVQLQGENFLAVAAPLLGNTSQPAAGFVLLTSIDQATLPARRAGNWILGLGLLAALATVAAAAYTSRRFLASIDKIEQGVTEIINGNHDYIFEKQGNIDFEGLENALNVMVAKLLGRPEPSEAGEVMVPMDMAAAPSASPKDRPQEIKLSPENQALAQEPEEQYRRRLYNEYVHAREQTGEGSRDLTFEGFLAKLRENETALCSKYGVRTVRFKVIIKEGQATLKPVPIP